MPELHWVTLGFQVFQTIKQHASRGFEIINQSVLLHNEALNFLVEVSDLTTHGFDYLEHLLLAGLDDSFFRNLDEVGWLLFSGLVS